MSAPVWSVVALVLLAVDNRTGCWCSIDFLCQRVMAPLHVVQRVCDDLVEQGQMERQVRDGLQYYGVHVQPDGEVVE